MKAFNMPILLWSVRMGEDLCELVLAKELLNCPGNKPAVIIIADLYLDLLSQTVIRLKIPHNDIFPDAFNLSLPDLIPDMPV